MKGESVIEKWMKSVAPGAQAKFDARLSYLCERNPSDWIHTYAHQLSDKIWEVKFEFRNIAYRPLFFLDSNPDKLVFVIFCTEKNNKIRPLGGLSVAFSRRDDVVSGSVKAIRYDG